MAKRKDQSRRKPKLGTGERFQQLVEEIKKRGKVKDPEAVAAAIGRKKFGKKRFQMLALAGLKRAKKKKK